MQGATPKVARAVALGSTTPAPADATPVEIVALPGVPRVGVAKDAGITQVARTPGRPDYASLIDQEQAGRERKCLAEAIYFEARSEPEDGQAAVAQVVLNRVTSGLYPSHRLRRRLPEPPPQARLPVLLRLRRQSRCASRTPDMRGGPHGALPTR